MSNIKLMNNNKLVTIIDDLDSNNELVTNDIDSNDKPGTTDDIVTTDDVNSNDELVTTDDVDSNDELVTNDDVNSNDEPKLNNEPLSKIKLISQYDSLSNTSDNEIHIYKQSRGRKSDTIISGLIFENKDDTKLFLSSCKKKFGIGGCHKMLLEINKDMMVFVFTGDMREKIKKLLINDYSKNEDLIKVHG